MKKKMTKREKKRLLFVWGMLALPLLQWLIFFVYVNIDSIVMTFQSMNYETQQIEWTLGNYERFFREWAAKDDLKVAIRNSVLAGINNMVLIMISLVLSYFFYKKIPGRNIFRVVYFLPSVISIVIYTMVYKAMFEPGVGPINILLERLGVPLADIPYWFQNTKFAFPMVLLYCLWVGTGYNILIFGAAMEGLPEDVMEYSRMEGVGKLRELFQIVVPMIWPTLAVAVLGSVTVIFTLFIQVQLLISDGGMIQYTQTIAYLVNSSVKGGAANPEWGATLGLCFTIIAAPIIVVLKKILDKIGERFGC